MGRLVARLAHHLLLWGKQGLSRGPATRWRLWGYGFVRLLRDVWAVPGVIRWRRGWIVRVRFSPLHPLATPLQESFAALFRGRVRVGYLRLKLAAVHEQAEAVVALATAQGFTQWAANGVIVRGWALATQGQGEEGMAQVRQGTAA